MPEFLVVSRAESGVRFGKDDPLVIMGFNTPVGPVDLLLKTRLSPRNGISKPVPMGLMAEVRGTAPNIDEAVKHFSRAAQSLCPLLAFIGNSPIEDMVPELSFDDTPGALHRQYFQQFVSEDPILIVERRKLSAALVARVLRAVVAHREADRIRRAIAHYQQALRNGSPGLEILSLTHLWMGAEALAVVVLRRLLEAGGITRAELAVQWGIDPRNVEAEVRRRMIFQGDDHAYQKAKEASDGFEHGYLSFELVHERSETVRLKVAAFLRSAILNELSLGAADAALLSGAPFDQPGHLRTGKYLRGVLTGGTGNLAATEQAYPFLVWSTSYSEVPTESPDEVSLTMNENLTGHFADGVTFHLGSIEVWGGQESSIRRTGA